jgi:hypothetical protein
MIYEQRASEIKLKSRRVIFMVVARRRDALSVAAEEWWRKGLRARKIGGSNAMRPRLGKPRNPR